MTIQYVPQGGEFRVNTYTDGNQFGPSVTNLVDGGFVVTWISYDQDGSGYGVFGQVYDGDGSRIGGEFRVNTYTTGDQADHSVTSLANGSFVVTWVSEGQDGSLSGVYGQVYDGDGSRVGGEFRVNTYTTGDQADHSVTSLANGNFVVTWVSDGSWISVGQDDSGSGVYGQVYGGNGSRFGGEFRLNTYTFDYQTSPSITSLADGSFVATWVSVGQDGLGSGVYGQLYSSNGSRIGSEFRVNAYTSGSQQEPTITSLADGGFVVIWLSDGQDGSGHGVYGQVYASIGSPVGGEFRVNTYTFDYQTSPSITSLVDGGFVVTWTSYGQDGSYDGVYGQIYGGDGSRVGGEFRVNTYTEGHQEDHSVTSLADGGFVVTWQSFGQDGSYDGVYGQAYRGDGSRIGGEFRVNSYTESGQSAPSITSLAGGGFVVTWNSNGQDGSLSGVYGQVFAPHSNSLPLGSITIFGTPQQAQTLAANISGIADSDGIDGSTVAYQWLRNGSAISGATDSSYRLTQADVGRTISVRYSYTDNYGTSESVVSSATSPVQNVNDLPRGQVLITVLVESEGGSGASAGGGGGSGSETSSSSSGSGASESEGGESSYASAGSGAGVTEGGSTSGVSVGGIYRMAQTAAMASPVSAVEGQTLQADVSGVTDADGINGSTVTYQWLRNGSAITGGHELNISFDTG